MPASNQFAYIEGLASLRRLLKPPSDELVNEPWAEAMADLAESGAEGGQVAAPYRTGKLRQKIYARVQKKPFPMWSAVRSRAKKRSKKHPRGYDYTRLLEYSPRHGHQGWFSRGVWPRLIGNAEAVLVKAAQTVGRKWERQ